MSVRRSERGEATRLSLVLHAGQRLGMQAPSSSPSPGGSPLRPSTPPSPPSPPSPPTPLDPRALREVLALPDEGEPPNVDKPTIRRIVASMILERTVVSATSEFSLLSRVSGRNLDDAEDWERVSTAALAVGKKLGAGAFNEAYSFFSDDLVYLKELFPANLELVLRYSSAPVQAHKAVLELVTAAYAGHHQFGPLIHAAWVTPDDEGDNNARKMAGYKGVSMNYITEKWTGDVFSPLASMMFTPSTFAAKFSDLLRRSIAHGFWQVDSKPDNVLYRYGATGLELCWTDFDPRFCSIVPTSVNSRIAICSVLVHAASFMGYMSCVMGKDVFGRYHPAMRAQLVTDFGIDTVSEGDVCDWLEQVGGGAGAGAGAGAGGGGSQDAALEDAKQNISSWLLRSMHNYITNIRVEPSDGDRCIIIRNGTTPSFQQMLDFSLLKVGEDQVEILATRFPLVFKRKRGQ